MRDETVDLNVKGARPALTPPAAYATRRQWLRLSLGAGAGLAGLEVKTATRRLNDSELIWRERRMQGLGTDLSLQAGHGDAEIAEAGLDAAVAAIRHVESQFSLFDPNSGISRLNRDGVLLQPHPDFVRLLSVAQQVSAKSGGSFDVTVQPLWEAWQRAKTEGRLPTHQELEVARSRIGWQFLQVSAHKISFKKPGMALTLNGIAQGFASDLASAALRAHGIADALLDTGEWTALGHSPQGGAWRLGVANPRDAQKLITTLALLGNKGAGTALATSSDTHCRFGTDDRHHHIFDPKIGVSPTRLASVTVLASNGTLADALTKVMFMGDKENALRLAKAWQVDMIAVDKSGHWLASSGLTALMAKN